MTSKDQTKLTSVALVAGLMCCIAAPTVLASDAATLKAGEHVVQMGEAAMFDINSSSAVSSDLQAWCEVSTPGRASLMFDAEHYIPLSEPSVGDVLSLSTGETRRFELHGTVEANRGDAYIAFAFTGVPTAMCFPGMQCDGATAGASAVKVVCDNY